MVVIEHANCQSVTNVTEEHAFFSTLQLLEFNVFSAEKQYKIQFKPDMFRVPNKKGLEVGFSSLFLSSFLNYPSTFNFKI